MKKQDHILLSEDTNALRDRLMNIYHLMFEYFGDRKWWPADTAEEVIIGAILVQSVSWANTVKAIDRLREQELLSFHALYSAELEPIESCITSTLYFKMKAKKLKAFATHLIERHHGSLQELFNQPLDSLRTDLLSIYGIGPETADDIVLYAAEKPSFVIDAYTKRIFSRLGIVREDIPYDELRRWFMDHLPSEVSLFNHYHALLDGVGHHFCSNSKPKCSACPLVAVCRHGKSTDEL